MAQSDPMFFEFELAIEELKSFVESRNYTIRARFGDIFAVKLKNPNEMLAEALTRLASKPARRQRMRQGKPVLQAMPVPSKQSVVVASDIQSLVMNMRKYPVELSLISKDNPNFLGLAEIPWGPDHIDYVNNFDANLYYGPLVVTGKHTVFDEYTSRRVAIVKITIKLSQVQETFIEKELLKPTIPEHGYSTETGTVRTIYCGKQRFKKSSNNKCKSISSSIQGSDCNKQDIITRNEQELNESSKTAETVEENKLESNISIKTFTHTTNEAVKNVSERNKIVSRLPSFHKNPEFDSSVSSLVKSEKNESKICNLVRSETDLNIDTKLFTVTKHWSSSSVEIKQRLDTLNYIFGNLDGPLGNQVYCVGYFTVENDNTAWGSKSGSKASSKDAKSSSSPAGSEKPDYNFKICDDKCPFAEKNTCFDNVCETDLPEEARHLITVTQCKNAVECDHKRQPLDPVHSTHEQIQLDFTNVKRECCVEKIEEVVGGMTAKMKVLEDPCYCTCECKFGFVKRTTYCGICGGFEYVGEDLQGQRGKDPFPCPVYHRVKEMEEKKAAEAAAAELAKQAKDKMGRDKKNQVEDDRKSMDSNKHKKRRKRDPRFIFNYGYKGIPPQIGHLHCKQPCGGGMAGGVPKGMGWLWTADNIPGLPKHRAGWRPGAANKHVVRMLRMARFPEQVIAKRKRREDVGKKGRKGIVKKPLLTVSKKDGEYHVAMQTMKQYSKPRFPNQYPYEDKPPLKYIVGRTEEENAERKKRKERAARRLQREQRTFIQSAFQDMCKEICLKTYQQALGIGPFTEDPPCTCFPEEPTAQHVDLSHSCSCSDSTRSSGSATDDDEWFIEFTPPNAFFDPAYKGKKILTADSSTQYSYIDYRVKLLDRLGNPVPRFFTGPDGKEQCSDLGGFWNPDKKWQEINVDGYIGPDGRWAPNTFMGPENDQVETEDGKFQLTNGDWLVVGVDGYVDAQKKWHFYSKKKNGESKKKKCSSPTHAAKKMVPPAGGKERNSKEATWSCFGDASPKVLSQMGILGHGHDRRILISTLEKMMAQGEDVKIPQSTVPRFKRKKSDRTKRHSEDRGKRHSDIKCQHRVPPAGRGIAAVDERGHKTYFTLSDYRNPRPKDRLTALKSRGISFSSFHLPCLNSFIDSEMMRKQQCEHIMQHNARILGTQTEE